MAREVIGISGNKQVPIEICVVRTLGFLNVLGKMFGPSATITRCFHAVDGTVRSDDVSVRPTFRRLGLGVSPLAKEVFVTFWVPYQRDIFGQPLQCNGRKGSQFLGNSILKIRTRWHIRPRTG